MVEVSKELIEKIIREVLSSLNINSLNFKKEKKNITAIFTGGKIAFEESLNQLEQIDNNFDVNWNFIFSSSAESLLDSGKIFSKLKADTDNLEADFECLDNTDLLIIPVLTRNTAAKLSAHFIDSKLLDYIFRALMCGIPVVAAKNAADISGKGWKELGMDKTPLALLEDNQKQLKKLKEYGIKLVDVVRLSEESAESLEISFNNKGISKGNYSVNSKNKSDTLDDKQFSSDFEEDNAITLDKKVLSYKDINPINNNIQTIYVRKDAVITPYAREVAENKGMIICLQPE